MDQAVRIRGLLFVSLCTRLAPAMTGGLGRADVQSTSAASRHVEISAIDHRLVDVESENLAHSHAIMRVAEADALGRQVLLRMDAPLERLRPLVQLSEGTADNAQRLKELVKEDATLAQELAFERGVREITMVLGWSAFIGAIFFPACYTVSAVMSRFRAPPGGARVEREREAPGASFGKWARAHPYTCMSLCEGVLLLMLMIGVIVLGCKAWDDFCAVTKSLGEASSSLGFDFYDQLTRGWAVSKILATMGVSGEQFRPVIDNTSPHELSVDFFTSVIKLESGSAVELIGDPFTVPAKHAINMTITGKVLPQDANLGDLPSAASSILATNGVHLGKELAEIVFLADIKGKLGREDFTISGEVSVPCLSKYLKRNGQPGFDAAVSDKVTECMIDGLLQYREERRSMVNVKTAVTSSKSFNVLWAMTWICAALIFACTGKCCVAATTSILDRSHAQGESKKPLNDGHPGDSHRS